MCLLLASAGVGRSTSGFYNRSMSIVTLKARGILFDMDGILISSIGSVERSWTHWCQLRGVNPAEALAIVHGCRAIDTLAKMRPDLDAHEELALLEQMEIDDVEDLRVLDGIPALLSSLPADRWTIVTSATERLARVRLGQAGLPVPAHIVTGDQVTHGKPHPEPYLAGARLLGLDPSECIVFEDAASGTNSGRAAGCTVVATLFSHREEQLAAAHYLVQDLSRVRAEVLGDWLQIVAETVR